MKNIFRYFIKNHTLAHLLTVIVFSVGIISLLQLNKDIFPKVTFDRLIVTTIYPGASPKDVELNVTRKIETELKAVSGLRKFISVSVENKSVIRIEIDPNVSDTREVKDEVRRAVQRVTDFPEEVIDSPLIVEMKSSELPILEVGLSGDIPYKKLRAFAEVFKKELISIEGVSRVKGYSYYPREIKIEASPKKMKKYNISFQEIIQAIQGRNIRSTGGSFESYTNEKNIVTLSQFKNPLEVKEVIVKSNYEGKKIKLKDLAEIIDGFEEPRVISTMKGKQTISFVIFKKEYADIIKTTAAIKVLVEEMKKYYPSEVKIVYANEVARQVKNRFDIVSYNGLIGLILVIIILTLFLHFNTAFWVSLGIPFSLLGVFAILKIGGFSLDSISMAALIIVIGIIVDDAIIVSENIFRHYSVLKKTPVDAAVDGLTEVFFPVLTTILTTFLAFAPMFFMKGEVGKFIFVVPFCISLALFISLFEVILILPSHLVPALNKLKKEKEGKFWIKIKKTFDKYLEKILRKRYFVLLIFIILLAGSLFYAKENMKFVLFPGSTADRFFINVEWPRGTSLKANLKMMKKLEKVVKNIPQSELKTYVTRSGKQLFKHGEYKENEHLGAIEVYLAPFGKRKRDADEIVEDILPLLNKIEGPTSIHVIVDSGGPPIGKPITVQVVGPGDENRKRLGKSLIEFFSTLDGVYDLERDDENGKDEIIIDLNYAELARLGLKVSDIAQAVRMAYDGQIITSIPSEDSEINFRILLEKKIRGHEDKLGNLLIYNKTRNFVPLKKVANFHQRPGPNGIYHYNGDRSITITGNVDIKKTTPSMAINKMKNHFNLKKDWPGFKFIIGGEAQEVRESMKSIISTFFLAGLGIYFLLILLFKSAFQPLYVLAAIPFGLIGVIIAFALHGEDLSFLAVLGVVGLMGVVVNDSLVLVDHLNSLKEKRKDEDFIKLVVEGTSNRLRAILVTTITTVVGLMPLAYGLGGSDPYMMPMALAMGYGLIFATPLTLFLIPCLYLIGLDFSSRITKI